jgi:MYXO-CTERM domain-containing protein
MHVFLDLPANLSDANILGRVGAGSQGDYWDRDLFKKYFAGLSAGNHAFTVVTYEITGTYNIQRFGGVWTDSPIGAGLGDVTSFTPGSPDGYIEGNDLDAIYNAVQSDNTQFYAPADFNGDGLMSLVDWQLLGAQLQLLHQQNAMNPGGGALVSQGTLDYFNYLSASVPEPGALGVLALLAPLLMRRRRRCNDNQPIHVPPGDRPSFPRGLL